LEKELEHIEKSEADSLELARHVGYHARNAFASVIGVLFLEGWSLHLHRNPSRDLKSLERARKAAEQANRNFKRYRRIFDMVDKERGGMVEAREHGAEIYK
jgi:hypothetical protein